MAELSVDNEPRPPTAEEVRLLGRYYFEPVFHASVHIIWGIRRRQGKVQDSSRPSLSDMAVVEKMERKGISISPDPPGQTLTGL